MLVKNLSFMLLLPFALFFITCPCVLINVGIYLDLCAISLPLEDLLPPLQHPHYLLLLLQYFLLPHKLLKATTPSLVLFESPLHPLPPVILLIIGDPCHLLKLHVTDPLFHLLVPIQGGIH